MPEVHHAAARHGISATEGREEKSLQQGVLLGVLVDRGALEAVDGGHRRCVQHHLLRVALRQGVVRLEEEDVWRTGPRTSGPANSPHEHAVDVEAHAPQFHATMGVVVSGIGASGDGLHLVYHDVFIRVALFSIVSGTLKRHRLDGLV